MPTYKIVRHYLGGAVPGPYGPSHAGQTRRRTIRGGLTLEQARAWCANPETSSAGTMPQSRRITRRNGPWFDGYSVER